MAQVTVELKLRPVKFAFLIDPTDEASLLEVIRTNSFLWGGAFNPIIPVLGEVSDGWKDRTDEQNPTSKKIIQGYLDAYDPDIVITFREDLWTSKYGDRDIVPFSEILAGVEEEGVPRFGIGLFEILNQFIEEELKFVRREPLELRLLHSRDSSELFLSSVFGALPDEINKILADGYSNYISADENECSLGNYLELLDSELLFLRRLTSLYVKPHRTRKWGGDNCIFLLDASNPLDIIDYWNLRALGWVVLPIAKQISEQDLAIHHAKEFIEENYYPFRGNPNIYNYTPIIKSRALERKDLDGFVESLKLDPTGEPTRAKIKLYWQIPQLWNKKVRVRERIECYELEAGSATNDLISYEDRISFKTLDPKFLKPETPVGEVRFANEIKLRAFSQKEILAEIIPVGDRNLITAIGGFPFEDWRFTRGGLVYLSKSGDWTIRLSLPRAEDVIQEWLSSKGWKVELSDKGEIAKQMLKRLGGIWGVSTLANAGIIDLLKKYGEGKTVKEVKLRGEVAKLINKRGGDEEVNVVLQGLINAQMFQLGIEVQCTICRQHSWYSVEDAKYELHCPKCLEKFPLPSHSTKEIKWSYRTFGPFSLPKQAYGVYSVLLTLRFFSISLRCTTTPLMCFTAKKGSKDIEADLCLFFQEENLMWGGRSETKLAFAECKTLNLFEARDAQRMMSLAEEFPDAALVFATLKPQLTEDEKELLIPVVERSRDFRKKKIPFNPVLILTGTELLSRYGPPMCWQDAGGAIASFANTHRKRDLVHLCDTTQQMHLGMSPSQPLLL